MCPICRGARRATSRFEARSEWLFKNPSSQLASIPHVLVPTFSLDAKDEAMELGTTCLALSAHSVRIAAVSRALCAKSAERPGALLSPRHSSIKSDVRALRALLPSHSPSAIFCSCLHQASVYSLTYISAQICLLQPLITLLFSILSYYPVPKNHVLHSSIRPCACPPKPLKPLKHKRKHKCLHSKSFTITLRFVHLLPPSKELLS